MTESVAPPPLVAASGAMPLDVTLITASFSGNAVPPNGCVPGGEVVEFVPVVAPGGGAMMGAPAVSTLAAAKLGHMFTSDDVLPNVVVGDAVVVIPAAELPDEEFEITVVAGAPPPPPPLHATRTKMQKAAARRTAMEFFWVT